MIPVMFIASQEMIIINMGLNFLFGCLQLLSSDDLWMYAPIAYNGMDIGLDLKIGTPKS